MAGNEGLPAPPGPHPQFLPLAAGGPASLVSVRTDWVAFYDAEYHAVVRFVMHAGAGLDDARDAASDAFLESWALLDRDPGRWSQIRDHRSWIRTVALRKRQRPPGRRRRVPLDSTATIPDLPDPGLDPGELTAQTQAVLDALRGLDEQGQMVMAFRMDHFPAAVIAEALGIPEQQVRDVTRKARAALKRTLATTSTREGRLPE
jgi:RNA polymerase sigma factor (sigma-70 family)